MSKLKKMLQRRKNRRDLLRVVERGKFSHQGVTFPLSKSANYFFAPLFPSDRSNLAYHTKFYHEATQDPRLSQMQQYGSEILRGQTVSADTAWVADLDCASALPIAVTPRACERITGGHEIRGSVGNTPLHMSHLYAHHFYYLPINEPAKVSLSCKHDMVVGLPIPLRRPVRQRRKLVLMLFVDSFAWPIMDRIDLQRDLPNISRFFSKGAVFDNCFGVAEWTLPSIPSIHSGFYPGRHRVFHPRQDYRVSQHGCVLPQLFQNAGYLTFQSCCVWRKSPAYGYVEGFDRTVYQRGRPFSDTSRALIEQLRAFPDRDHFCWLSAVDLHHPLMLAPDISSQLQTPLGAFHFASGTNVRTGQDAGRATRYVEELKRLDYYLGSLFDQLERQFTDEEMVVCLFSDHGVRFIGDDDQLLSPDVTNIACMMRGGGVPAGRTGELVQNIDLLPSLLHLCDLDGPAHIDGRLPQVLGGSKSREYVFSQSIYPGQTYKASVKDGQYEFYFETCNPVDDDGQTDFDKAHCVLRLLGTHADISAEHAEVAGKFRRICEDHVIRDHAIQPQTAASQRAIRAA